VPCASERLLRHTRSGALADHGLLVADDSAPHGWRVRDSWRSDDARAFTEGLLDCSADWRAALGEQWHLQDTDCLSDVGASAVAGILAQQELAPRDEGLADDNDETARRLDDCYARTPAPPTGTVRAGYRSVEFVLTDPSADNGVAELSVGTKVASRRGGTTTYRTETEAGGRRACVDARTVVSYGWGTSRSATRHLCGTARPPRIRWVKERRCDAAPGCVAYDLHVEGFASFEDLAVRNVTHGNFDCGTRCRKTITTGYDGRGVGNGWYFDFTPHGSMTARVGRYADTLHFR
jgi:hypothetical protein